MQQGLLKIDSWQSAYRLADEALHGVLKRYERRQPQSLPHVYHPATSGVILDVAWPSQKVGVYVDLAEQQRKTLQQAGWSLMTIDQALKI